MVVGVAAAALCLLGLDPLARGQVIQKRIAFTAGLDLFFGFD